MGDAREELAKEMDRQRMKLRLRWTEVARRAGMTPGNLVRIRKGEVAMTEWAAKGIEQALEWEDGHIAARLNTGSERKPAPVFDPIYLEAIRAEIAHMTPSQTKAMAQRVEALMGGEIARRWEQEAAYLQGRARRENQIFNQRGPDKGPR